MKSWIESSTDAVRGQTVVLHIKVVPGASRDEIAGLLGDRLKLRIAAPPEGGKANKAVRQLLARSLGIKISGIEIMRGRTSPEKSLRLSGISMHEAASRILG